MKLFQKIFFLIVITLLAFIAPSIANAGTIRLGGMDLDGYCRSIGQTGVSLTNNNWACQPSNAAINMTSACQWQYPNQNALAIQDTPDNPYTWTCYREDTQLTPTPGTNPTATPSAPSPTISNTPTQTPAPTPTPTGTQIRLGGMNLDGYCRSLNLPNAVVNNGVWTCGQSGVVINLTSACQWQYVPSAVARQDVLNNPYTWSCYTTSSNITPTPTPTMTPTPTPTIRTTPTLSPTMTPTPTPVTNVRIRRSIYSLNSDELRRLTNAINTLRNNGVYRDFMNRHIQAMMTETPAGDPTTDRNVAHRGPAFLPWHRAFIYEFEEQLRAVDPTVTLPYWPFEQDAGTAPRVFTAAYFGSDGNRTQNDRVTDGPFASWGITRRIGRDPDTLQTSLPTIANTSAVLQNTIYSTSPYNEQSAGVVMGMEGWTGINSPWGMHNRVHGYIGGDMGTMDSANDPVFFLVHANIDRLWWQWEQQRGITNYQPVSGGPEGHNLNDPLRFLLRVPTAADVLDIQNDMGYTYN